MKYKITKEFETLIGDSRLESLNGHPGSIYGVDSEFNISYLNPAWFEFSDKNGDNIFNGNRWSLGSNLFDAIPEVLQPFYKSMFESSLKDYKSKVVSTQSEYECSSKELYRKFSMHLYPIDGVGVVVVHSLLIEKPYTPHPIERLVSFDENDYIDRNEILRQCANCRRIQNLKTQGRWDWVPIFIEEPHSKTSHGICEPCLQHYYLSEK